MAPYKAGTMVSQIKALNAKGFVRLFTKGVTKMEGGWIAKSSEIEGLSPTETQSKFSVPNTPDNVADVDIPNGTVMRAGVASAAFDQKGGGIQYQLMGKASFSNARPLELPMPDTESPTGKFEYNESVEPVEPVEPIEPIL